MWGRLATSGDIKNNPTLTWKRPRAINYKLMEKKKIFVLKWVEWILHKPSHYSAGSAFLLSTGCFIKPKFKLPVFVVSTVAAWLWDWHAFNCFRTSPPLSVCCSSPTPGPCLKSVKMAQCWGSTGNQWTMTWRTETQSWSMRTWSRCIFFSIVYLFTLFLMLADLQSWCLIVY